MNYNVNNTYKQVKKACQNRCASPKNRYRSAPLFESVALDWLKNRQGTVKESTYAAYVNAVERHILPILGSLPVAHLRHQMY